MKGDETKDILFNTLFKALSPSTDTDISVIVAFSQIIIAELFKTNKKQTYR